MATKRKSRAPVSRPLSPDQITYDVALGQRSFDELAGLRAAVPRESPAMPKLDPQDVATLVIGIARRIAEPVVRKRFENIERELPREVVERLSAHDYPGNIRELRNILERSLLRTEPDSRWLILDTVWARKPAMPVARLVVESPNAAPAGGGASAGTDLPGERADLPPLEAQEYRMIRETLKATGGGIRRTAAQLGLSPQALLRRLEKWPELRPPAT